MGHIVDVQCFEMLGALKSNSSVGRAMPELVERGAMGVAAMGAGRVDKGVEDGKFFFGKAAQGMCEEKPRMQFTRHGFGNSAHDPWVELANVSHVGASAGTKLCAHMSAGKMQQRFHKLHRACEKAELKLVRIKNGPVAIHTHAVVKKLQQQQQPNGPSRGHNCRFPRLVGRIAWGAGDKLPR